MDLCISVRRKCSPVHHLLEYIKEIRMHVDEGWKEREREGNLFEESSERKNKMYVEERKEMKGRDEKIKKKK
jgi:hypothetical protein